MTATETLALRYLLVEWADHRSLSILDLVAMRRVDVAYPEDDRRSGQIGVELVIDSLENKTVVLGGKEIPCAHRLLLPHRFLEEEVGTVDAFWTTWYDEAPPATEPERLEGLVLPEEPLTELYEAWNRNIILADPVRGRMFILATCIMAEAGWTVMGLWTHDRVGFTTPQALRVLRGEADGDE